MKPLDEPTRRASVLFLEHIDYVRLIAFECAPSRSILGDIVNDVFCDFVSKADHWDLTRDIRPLLAGMTRNIAFQYWRKHLKNMPDAIQKLAEEIRIRNGRLGFFEDVREESPDREEELLALDLCMEQLPKEHVQLLEAHYFQSRSVVEIAEESGRKVNTLYSVLTRLRVALRKCVENKLGGGLPHVE